jgi:hypothetical protein
MLLSSCYAAWFREKWQEKSLYLFGTEAIIFCTFSDAQIQLVESVDVEYIERHPLSDHSLASCSKSQLGIAKEK